MNHEVILEETGPIADFQQFRTDIMSEMLDNPKEGGIFKTGRFYSKLDDYVRKNFIPRDSLIKELEGRKVEAIDFETRTKNWLLDDLINHYKAL